MTANGPLLTAKEIPNRPAGRRGRRLVAVLVGVAAVALTTVLATPVAWAAGGVTITTSFENDPISLNTTDAVGYALTNTTGVPQTVTFTNTLPSGVTLDNPPAATLNSGTSTSCSLATPAAGPGSSSVTVTVGVPPASGTVCTVWFDVVAVTPSNDVALSDTYSGLSATTVTPTATPGSLVVLSNPVLSFTAPASGQTFYLGQLVDAQFSCAATDPLDSIDSFFGTDDEGNQIESGAPIDTLDPGTHTLQVDCYSAAGGGAVSQTVTYTVGSYALVAVHAAKGTDVVSFRTRIPAGKLITRVFYGRKVVGVRTLTTTALGVAEVTVRPTAAGRHLLAPLRGRFATLRLQVSFDPAPLGSGDQQITAAAATILTRTVKLPLGPAAPPGRRAAHSRRARRAYTTGHVVGSVDGLPLREL